MMTRASWPDRRGPRALSRFLGETRGTPLIEFALIAPILVTMLVGAVDFGRYILLNQKLSRTASTLGDLLARDISIAPGDFAGIFAAADQTMSPFDIADGGVLVLTMAQVDSGTPRITQRHQSPSDAAVSGLYGDVGETLTGIPEGLLIDDGDELIVAEVRFQYDAWMLDFLSGGGDLYHVAYYRPR